MKIAILETKDMYLCRPSSIKEIFRAEDVTVYCPSTHKTTQGDQVMFEGSGVDFSNWLTPFVNVWFNFGAMQLEQFSLVNLIDNPINRNN